MNAVATLPTNADLEEARFALSQATQVLVGLSARVRRFLNEQYVDAEHETIVEDATPATFAELGLLLTWNFECAGYTRELMDYIDTIGGQETLEKIEGALRLHEKRAEVHGVVTPRA